LVDCPPLGEEYLEPWFPDLLRRADAFALVLAPPRDPDAQLAALEAILGQYQLVLAGRDRAAPSPGLSFRRALIIFNKIDLLPDPEELALYLEVLGERLPVRAVSALTGQNLPELRQALFAFLNLVRVYTRAPGKAANFKSPFVLPAESTLQELADRIHHDLGRSFKFARVWGKDTFEGQRVQRDYLLREGDIVEIHT
jgi:hypothetical protein